MVVYYLVANLSALRQRVPDRRFPRALQVVGAVGCVVLVATLPVSSVVAGVGVFALGVAYSTALDLVSATRLRWRAWTNG